MTLVLSLTLWLCGSGALAEGSSQLSGAPVLPRSLTLTCYIVFGKHNLHSATLREQVRVSRALALYSAI
jgi:hypothetical protein